MTPNLSADHCASLVKQHDPVRFVTALFAPEATRRKLYALYALDAELRRIPEAAREPMIIAIRFQWWRDALAALPGTTRGHPVLTEVAGIVGPEGISTAALKNLVDERERIAEPAITEDAIISHAARLCGAPAGENPIAEAAAVAIVTGDRNFLAEARRLWRPVRKTRKAELPAYLPATFVDARHPVSALRLHWRALTMALRNRF
ncbi:hypothetical protein sos41_24330 [Alphaproteobacteria bacterium SO-S41]|nr:hypothetical protein sos41_24330 [Alphaproteobacteria bacterium SO-S41]